MLSPNGLTTVLFDLDGTLRVNHPHGNEVFWEFAQQLMPELQPEDRHRAQQWAFEYWAESEDLREDIKSFGSTKEEEFWFNYARRHLTVLGLENDQAQEKAPQANKYMRTNYNPEDIVPEDVPETLKILKEAGLILGVITNRGSSIDEYMREIELAEFMDFYFAAGDIGFWKPNPEIFHYALGQANAKAEESIYVGDNYYADVVGARAAGLEAVLIDPNNHFPAADCVVIHKFGELIDHIADNRAS